MWITLGIALALLLIAGLVGKVFALHQAETAAKNIAKRKMTKIRYLKHCHNLISGRFRSTSYGFLRYFWRNVYLDNIWKKGNVLPCHVQSTLLEQCLRLRFKKEEVRKVWIRFTAPKILHNFLEVKVGGKWISVDPWGRQNGIPFGESMLSVGYGGRNHE